MLKGRQRYITSGGQAEMGYTIPAAIGVFLQGGRKKRGDYRRRFVPNEFTGASNYSPL
jgi:glyoxylate carboligase